MCDTDATILNLTVPEIVVLMMLVKEVDHPFYDALHDKLIPIREQVIKTHVSLTTAPEPCRQCHGWEKLHHPGCTHSYNPFDFSCGCALPCLSCKSEGL